eukprot:3372334-Amphidinium_carterae.1
MDVDDNGAARTTARNLFNAEPQNVPQNYYIQIFNASMEDPTLKRPNKLVQGIGTLTIGGIN